MSNCTESVREKMSHPEGTADADDEKGSCVGVPLQFAVGQAGENPIVCLLNRLVAGIISSKTPFGFFFKVYIEGQVRVHVGRIRDIFPLPRVT